MKPFNRLRKAWMPEEMPPGNGVGGLEQEEEPRGDAPDERPAGEPQGGTVADRKDYFEVAGIPKPHRLTAFTLVLLLIFVASGLTLLVITSLGVFKDYFEGHFILWILRIGIILIIASLMAFVFYAERLQTRYLERVISGVIESNQRLERLLRAGREMGATLDTDEIAESFLDFTFEEVRADTGAVYLVDRSDRVLRLAVTRGVDAADMMFSELPLGTGLVGEAAERREAVVIMDTGELDERDNVFFGAADPKSELVVPLVSGERPVGVIVLGSMEGPYGEKERNLLVGLAELAGLTIANAELYGIARRSLDALSRQKGVTGSMLDEMVAGVITADSGGRIEVFNREAQRLTGFSLGEMSQTRLRTEASLESNPLAPLQEGMLRVLNSPAGPSEGEALVMKKDKTLLPVSYRIYPLASGNEVVGAAAVFMEAVEDGSRAAEAGPDYGVLLRSLGTRIEGLYTHPLSTVIERVRQMGQDEWARSKEDLAETLEAGSAALLGLLEETEHYLNCMTIREWDSRVECDVGAIVPEVVAKVVRSPEHEGVVVSVKLGPLPKAFGYERMIRYALEEVIENAVLAAAEQGQRVQVTGRSEGASVEVLVRDSGPGIPPETAGYMYLPFFSGREGRPGLGLSTARRVLERLGGGIGYENTATGTVFSLKFPTSLEPEPEEDG
jgi:signal transduction histidine kinase